MRKTLICLVLLALSTLLFAQAATVAVPAIPAPAPLDYSLHYTFVVGPSFNVMTGTKGADFKDNLGAYTELTIPVSQRFSFKVYGFSNWNSIQHVFGVPGLEQNLNTTTLDTDLRFVFNPHSKYQAYIIGGLSTYRTSWYDNVQHTFTKLDYSIGGGGYFYFNNGLFVVSPEIRYAPSLTTWALRVKADCFIWKRIVAITPEVKWSNLDITYIAGTGLNIKGHADSYSLCCGITFRF